MKYIVSFILFFLIFQSTVLPQNQRQQQKPGVGTIIGKVQDEVTEKPIEFATIGLKSQRKDMIVNGTVTDQNGKFTIDKIQPGKYLVIISFIGYKDYQSDTIRINQKNNVVDLGTIKLASSSVEYKEFTVTGEKKLLETSIDKKVFNVSQNISSEGGSAIEVLEKVPSIEVDIEGNVSLRGNSNVRILIDGRPSGLTGSSKQAVLEQIPASSIESIEIVTNPSAKYDPEGMVGIINVVLKKDKRTGTNGNINLSVGTRDQYNFNFGINNRNAKTNLFANYSYRESNRWYSGETYRKLFNNDTTNYLDQLSDGRHSGSGHMVKLGCDFYINEKTTVGISVTQNISGSSSKDINYYHEYNNVNIYEEWRHRYVREDEDETNTDINLYYQKWFTSRKENLMVDFNFSTNKENEKDIFNEYDVDQFGVSFDSLPDMQNNYQDEGYMVGSLRIDYVKPFKEKRKLETGYDGRFRIIDNNFKSETYSYSFNEFQNDVNLSNNFIYTEEIHALYATYTDHIFGLDFQAGLRAEQAFTTSELRNTNDTYKNDYFSLFPTLHVTKELENNQDLQFSYSRRINRPRVRSLNPFTDYDDPLNLRIGNPYLNPEYINSYEVSYYKEWGKTQLISSIYYKRVYDVINRYKTVDTNGVSTTTYANMSTATSYGFEFIFISNLTKWWNINTSANLYRNITDAENLESDLNADAYAMFGKLNSTMNLKYNIQFQVSGMYRSPRVFPQGEMKAMYFMDMALKKSFFDKKFFVTLRMSDVLNTRRFEYISEGFNFYQESLRQRQSQFIYLNLSYRFGKPFKDNNRKKNGRDSMNDNMDDFDID